MGQDDQTDSGEPPHADDHAKTASGDPNGGEEPVTPKKRRLSWRDRFKRLGLLLVSLLVAALLAELAVTLIYGTQVRFPRRVLEAPWGLRFNDPGAVYRHTSPDGQWRFQINSQGMRDDRDFEYDKPPGTKRIISLGDSFTIGYEVAADQTFSAVLEHELRTAGHNVEVLNAGVSGYSNAEACAYLERELLKYQPDLVLVSFYSNDLVDNVRAGVYRLDGEQLVEKRHRYIPAGRLGNFLNSNWLFNKLSEHSNAFAMIKERITLAMKREMVEQNLENLTENEADLHADKGADSGKEKSREAVAEYRSRLAAAIFKRLYDVTREHDVPLVVQSIPHRRDRPTPHLVDAFPADAFGMTVQRPGFTFMPMKPRLDPHVGKTQLYWNRSHRHWTPFAHEQSGKALAQIIIEQRLLGDLPK